MRIVTAGVFGVLLILSPHSVMAQDVYRLGGGGLSAGQDFRLNDAVPASLGNDEDATPVGLFDGLFGKRNDCGGCNDGCNTQQQRHCCGGLFQKKNNNCCPQNSCYQGGSYYGNGCTQPAPCGPTPCGPSPCGPNPGSCDPCAPRRGLFQGGLFNKNSSCDACAPQGCCPAPQNCCPQQNPCDQKRGCCLFQGGLFKKNNNNSCDARGCNPSCGQWDNFGAQGYMRTEPPLGPGMQQMAPPQAPQMPPLPQMQPPMPPTGNGPTGNGNGNYRPDRPEINEISARLARLTYDAPNPNAIPIKMLAVSYDRPNPNAIPIGSLVAVDDSNRRYTNPPVQQPRVPAFVPQATPSYSGGQQKAPATAEPTFPYDGGPRNPVPFPSSAPSRPSQYVPGDGPISLQSSVSPVSVTQPRPTQTPASSRYVYKAYGE